jgi:tetratricopeptide (TPR) repeat protein
MKNSRLLLLCRPALRVAKTYSPKHWAAFILTAVLLIAAPARAQEAARPEVGKPLQAAQEQLKAGRYKDALAKVREADTVANKSAYETYLIESMRGSAASGAGDTDTAIKAFEAVLVSNKAPAATQLKIVEALAVAYYRAKNYAAAIKTAQRYFHDGGSGGQMRTLLIQSYFQSGDVANAAKETATFDNYE